MGWITWADGPRVGDIAPAFLRLSRPREGQSGLDNGLFWTREEGLCVLIGAGLRVPRKPPMADAELGPPQRES
jgi:hypothetical protein